jgi:hypothetical protein
MEEDMQKKQKARSQFNKLMDPRSKRWRLVDLHDVFSLPPLPPGKSEYLAFDPSILPPNSTEFDIIDAIWDREMHEAFISDMNKQDNWNYDRTFRWTQTSPLTHFLRGIVLLIRADWSARSDILSKIGFKIKKDNLAITVIAALDFVAKKWPQFAEVIPGQDLVRRFIANCRLSPENEALLSKKLTRCILPHNGGRRMANDEKGAKFTGNSSDLLAANKPEGKVVTWTADVTLETRFNESFLIHAKTHHVANSGPQSIWNEYFSAWCDVADEVAHESTVLVSDSHYMCNEVLQNALERDIKFMSGFASNKFTSITKRIQGRANKANEWVALYNESHNLLVMKRTDHEGKTKFCISNYMVHSRHAKVSDLHQWDAYNEAYYLSDRFHEQITTKAHRRWPFRHGSHGHPGVGSHIFDILWCFVIEDVRVAYRALRSPDVERPKYAPFLASLAIYFLEKGLEGLSANLHR